MPYGVAPTLPLDIVRVWPFRPSRDGLQFYSAAARNWSSARGRRRSTQHSDGRAARQRCRRRRGDRLGSRLGAGGCPSLLPSSLLTLHHSPGQSLEPGAALVGLAVNQSLQTVAVVGYRRYRRSFHKLIILISFLRILFATILSIFMTQ